MGLRDRVRHDRVEVLLRERLRREGRLRRVRGERQVHLGGPPAQRFGRAEVAPHHGRDDLRHRRRHQIGERVRCRTCGRGLAFDLIEEAADLVDGVSPAVGLALDELLQHRERARFVPGADVLEGARHGRDALEANLLGQLPADLEVRVDPRFQAPEEFHDQPIAVHDRGIGLLAGRAGDGQRVGCRSAKRGKRAGLHHADAAALGRGLLLPVQGFQHGPREAVVQPGVEQEALARAGDRREHGVRRPLRQCARLRVGANRQRQEVVMMTAVVELDLHDGEEQRLGAAPQRAPVRRSGPSWPHGPCRRTSAAAAGRAAADPARSTSARCRRGASPTRRRRAGPAPLRRPRTSPPHAVCRHAVRPTRSAATRSVARAVMAGDGCCTRNQ